MNMLQTNWEGYYLDGRTAARRKVTVQLMRLGLHVTTETGETLWWPYENISQTQGFYAGEQVRLEKGEEFPEILLVSDDNFLVHLHQAAPELGKRFHHPASRRRRPGLIFFAALASIAVITILYFWGIPALAGFVAPRVPVSWEEHLGVSVTEHLAPEERRCSDPSRMRIINEIVAKLTSPLQTSPYTFRVIVVDDPMVNAFAAPGGYIVLMHGLLEHTQTAEELAGVLAHELQHVLRRHTTQSLIQHLSTGLLLAALTGDASGTAAYGLEGARLLGILRYTRTIEEEADHGGVQMLLDAGIDPKGMIRFFEGLQQNEIEIPSVLKYLSTHPQTGDRIQKLKLLTAQSSSQPVRLFPKYDWTDLKNICLSKVNRG